MSKSKSKSKAPAPVGPVVPMPVTPAEVREVVEGLPSTAQACVAVMVRYGAEAPDAFLAGKVREDYGIGCVEGTYRNNLHKAYKALGIGKAYILGQGSARTRLARAVGACGWTPPAPKA